MFLQQFTITATVATSGIVIGIGTVSMLMQNSGIGTARGEHVDGFNVFGGSVGMTVVGGGSGIHRECKSVSSVE